MASSTTAIAHRTAGPYPSLVTLAAAANSLYPEYTIVGRDTAGRAYAYTTADASGYPAMGVARNTYDNRTGGVLGLGSADAIDIQVDPGVHGFSYTGTAPLPGERVYVVDNQTVSGDSAGGTRGVAGICTEVRTLDGVAKCFVMMGPHAVGIPSAAPVVTGSVINVPLASFVDADGDPLAKFVSASSPTFGFNLADSEALNIRWNNDAAPGTALCQVGLPPDLDDTEDITLEFLVSKSGATLGDATTLTITAFILAAGDLHDADANCGGVTAALVGNATAKTTTLLTRTIAAADVPAGARSMTFTVTPTAGLLGTDDLMLHDVKVRFTRK